MAQRKIVNKRKSKLKKPGSTPNKPDELPPQSAIEKNIGTRKSLNINWDVLGFSSAALTLFGAALLFIFGWAYEVNWYGYFGVNMFQLNSAPQNVIIQSIPSLVTIFSAFILAIAATVIIDPLAQFINYVTSNIRTQNGVGKLQAAGKLSFKREYFNIQHWIAIAITVEVFLLLQFYLSWINIKETYGDLNVIYEIFYLEFFATIFRYGILSALIVSIVTGIGAWIILKIAKLNPPYQLKLRIPQATLFLFILVLSITFTSISMSAIYGLNDAARGIRGSGGWSIQPVLLATANKIEFTGSIDQTCSVSGCMSGPFGLIGQNETYFILIKWKNAGDVYFRYHPGLYVIPRNENTYLLPAVLTPTPESSLQLSPTPSPLPTITSTTKP